jgi:E3 ubiquitin-protein ligase UBR1
LQKIPQALQAALEQLVALMFDFILDTFDHSPSNVEPPSSSIILENIKKEMAMPLNPQFVCHLWNDEVHSFQEVIDILVEALNVTEDEAKQFAEEVDTKVSLTLNYISHCAIYNILY